jgi:hypothetical protein
MSRGPAYLDGVDGFGGAPWDRVFAKSSAADFPTKGLHG